MYEYSATVLQLVDTHTLVLSIDLGFGVSVTQQVTLGGITAPEPLSHGETQAVLEGLVISGKIIEIHTFRVKDNFEVTLFMNLINITDALVASGYRWRWDGGQKGT
jgi:hypothetical protein